MIHCSCSFQISVPEVVMPNSILLPPAALDKMEAEKPAAATIESSGKLTGESNGLCKG